MRTRTKSAHKKKRTFSSLLYKYRKPLYHAAKKYTPALMHSVGLGKHVGKVQQGFNMVDTGLALRKRIKSQL